MTNLGDPQRPQQDRGHYGAGWSQPAPPAAPAAGAGPAGGPSAGPDQGVPGQQHPAQQLVGQQYPGQQYPGQQYPGQHQGQQYPGQQYPGQHQGQQYPGQHGPGQAYPGQHAPQRPASRVRRGEDGRSSAQRFRVHGDPRRAFAPGASVATTTGALIAVVAIVVVEFLSGLVGLLGTAAVVHPFSTAGTGVSLLASFADAVFAAPFPYYAGAFLALAFLTPINRRSPLPVVLLRAVLAGAAGTVGLALVGVFTGSYAAVHGGPGRLLMDVVTTPLQRGLPFTLMLIATSTAAWLWLGRPRGDRAQAATRGTPGRVRPADAVPPATIQQQQPGPQWAPVPHSGAQQAGPYSVPPQYPSAPQTSAQQPANPWGPTAPR